MTMSSAVTWKTLPPSGSSAPAAAGLPSGLLFHFAFMALIFRWKSSFSLCRSCGRSCLVSLEPTDCWEAIMLSVSAWVMVVSVLSIMVLNLSSSSMVGSRSTSSSAPLPCCGRWNLAHAQRTARSSAWKARKLVRAWQTSQCCTLWWKPNCGQRWPHLMPRKPSTILSAFWNSDICSSEFGAALKVRRWPSAAASPMVRGLACTTGGGRWAASRACLPGREP
mmetsp:Transcript_117576/g.379474  ORF Transcript_117576/g.379474 Transcript_117576/m.379474 type:complete len:222 (-) Transcript_117576:7-672(-)